MAPLPVSVQEAAAVCKVPHNHTSERAVSKLNVLLQALTVRRTARTVTPLLSVGLCVRLRVPEVQSSSWKTSTLVKRSAGI